MLGVVIVVSLTTTNAWAAPTTSTTTVVTSTTGVVARANNLACATTFVTGWSLEQLANQTIVVSVNAANVGAMVPAARAGYGGLLLFGSSAPLSIGATLAVVQAHSLDRFPMLVMTDEEGGGVQRLTNVIGSLPWAKTMGKNLDTKQIAAEGKRIGTALLGAGVNVDLAPVLDVDARNVEPGVNDPDGLRSFSGVASVAGAAGSAFMAGLQSAGVTSVVKHFPGLGGSSRDTDYGPAATLPWSVLRTTGLVPFMTAIANGAQAVMMSNASVPGFTALPASISPAMIAYLRGTLGFHGLIVTDSLSAGAISALHLSVPEAAVRALQAGSNLVLYGSPGTAASSLALAQAISIAIVSAVTSGSLARSTLVGDAAQVIATRETVPC